MKGVALVNGVPASGKSSTARALSQATGWPLLTLDTVKEALFEELGTGDRDYNRKLGRAAYRAMFAIVGEAPPGSRFVMDAWFGFQPRALLDELAARAGVGALRPPRRGTQRRPSRPRLCPRTHRPRPPRRASGGHPRLHPRHDPTHRCRGDDRLGEGSAVGGGLV